MVTAIYEFLLGVLDGEGFFAHLSNQGELNLAFQRAAAAYACATQRA